MLIELCKFILNNLNLTIFGLIIQIISNQNKNQSENYKNNQLHNS